MAWIETVNESDWQGDLAKMRNQLADPATGQVDNILSVHSLDPGSLRAHVDLYMQAMHATESLPKVDREMIAVVVSKENSCHY